MPTQGPVSPSAQRFSALEFYQGKDAKTCLIILCCVQRGRMPIHLAASMGYGDIIALLVRHGSPLHVLDYDGIAPLHQAVKEGHVKAAEAVIACRASATAALLVWSFPCRPHQIDAHWSLMLQ